MCEGPTVCHCGGHAGLYCVSAALSHRPRLQPRCLPLPGRYPPCNFQAGTLQHHYQRLTTVLGYRDIG